VVWVSAAGGVAVDPDGAAAADEAEEADGAAGAVDGAEVGCAPGALEPPQAAVARLAVAARLAAVRYRRARMTTTVWRRPEADRPDTRGAVLHPISTGRPPVLHTFRRG
jgi:hypothetical protein